jgi:hypothetical protein
MVCKSLVADHTPIKTSCKEIRQRPAGGVNSGIFDNMASRAWSRLRGLADHTLTHQSCYGNRYAATVSQPAPRRSNMSFAFNAADRGIIQMLFVGRFSQ